MSTAPLSPHPATPAPWIDEVVVRVAADGASAVALAFRVRGDVERVRVPSPRPPARADGLWRHTCFEAFVRSGEGPAYVELNFSPAGEWAAYAFRGYRDGGVLDVPLDPAIVVRRGPGELTLEAAIPGAVLPPTDAGVGLRLGLAAVIEDLAGNLSYWALRHGAGRPDFHHPEAFALSVQGVSS